MLSLFGDYNTEIMVRLSIPDDLVADSNRSAQWCDIGGPNKTLEFAAQFYNNAYSNGKQVTINNREPIIHAR
jgi:hypothetical protein